MEQTTFMNGNGAVKPEYKKNKISHIIREGYMEDKDQQLIADELNLHGFCTKSGVPWKKTHVSYYATTKLKLFLRSNRKRKNTPKVKIPKVEAAPLQAKADNKFSEKVVALFKSNLEDDLKMEFLQYLTEIYKA